MKKTMHFLLVAVALVFGMTSCDEFKSIMDNPVSSYLELKTTSAFIVPGGTYQIEASSISNAKITYESSNPDVAIVDPSGKVTALEDGEATITVRIEANDNYQAGATQFQVKVQSPLTLEAKADGVINVNYYNGITLDEPIVYTIFTKEGLKKTVSITGNTAIEVDKGDKVQFMSKNDQLATGGWSDAPHVQINPTVECAVYGNVMSMITPEGDFNTNKMIKKEYALCGLFNNNNLISNWDGEKWTYEYAIVNHDKYKLVLPATTLSTNCYSYMFNNSGLTEAPELPATMLANGCYIYMFSNCKNLTVAPKLPATNLASWCYEGMFSYSGITEAPELKVEDLSNGYGCYYGMFQGCYELTKAPKLPAKKLSNYCYAYMFFNCSKLEVAPVLPAAELFYQCYSNMFTSCSKLKSLTCLATSITDNSATQNWLYGAGANVEGECTFTKAASAAWDNTTGMWNWDGTNGWKVTNRWTIAE